MVLSTAFYDFLGVNPKAEQHEIAEAFEIHAKTVHPGRQDGGNVEEYKKMLFVFVTLFVDKHRKVYDESGEGGVEDLRGAAEGLFRFKYEDENKDGNEETSESNESCSGEVIDEALRRDYDAKRAVDARNFDVFLDLGAARLIIEVVDAQVEKTARHKDSNNEN